MDSPIQVGSLIHSLRGRKVILDRDLASLYGVTVKALNRSVQRNIERFPDDFMFRLTLGEARSLRCQFGTLKRGAHIKYPPAAFTEQGVAMLSSVLRSQRAIQVNIAIVRAFVELRGSLAARGDLALRLAEIEGVLASHGSELGEHARLIAEGFEAVRRLMEAPEAPRKRIGFGRGEDPA